MRFSALPTVIPVLASERAWGCASAWPQRSAYSASLSASRSSTSISSLNGLRSRTRKLRPSIWANPYSGSPPTRCTCCAATIRRAHCESAALVLRLGVHGAEVTADERPDDPAAGLRPHAVLGGDDPESGGAALDVVGKRRRPSLVEIVHPEERGTVRVRHDPEVLRVDIADGEHDRQMRVRSPVVAVVQQCGAAKNETTSPASVSNLVCAPSGRFSIRERWSSSSV